LGQGLFLLLEREFIGARETKAETVRTSGMIRSIGWALLLSALGLLSNLGLLIGWGGWSSAQDVIPYHQDQVPGPALSPTEALAKMSVPAGFSVELVASEPDLMNPVAMAFDERGRIWVTESFEYPRAEAGPGRDRIKILSDEDGDGRAERVEVFAEGLNIPSGIAVGHGGVWVANAPDLLFLQDTDGDGRADRSEVVLTGFGRTDTHELPNSLHWGPDGWLYGLNGVFNRSKIEHQGTTHEFTCALWRLHPRTRAFELFVQGTSNPWGLAWDREGSAFVSACVIDHMWHLTETGYYQRQAGASPPGAWVLGSICDHAHQKAAYCGLTYFDSAAYPEEYRECLYMGNIHAGAINVDVLARSGASYRSSARPDFLVANDAWFMPVAQQTGPDGCLYVLDWYDRYHCYQDAHRDPAGIDRAKGRLYRVVYGKRSQSPAFDLTRESNEQLLARLSDTNIYYRETAQRLLSERNDPAIEPLLAARVADRTGEEKGRRHALWALAGRDEPAEAIELAWLNSSEPFDRAWGVRAAGNWRTIRPAVLNRIAVLAREPMADVQVQVAIAARKLPQVDALNVLVDVLTHSEQDEVLAAIAWQNMQEPLRGAPELFVQRVEASDLEQAPNLAAVLPRAVELLMGLPANTAPLVARLVASVGDQPGVRAEANNRILEALARRELSATAVETKSRALRAALAPVLAPYVAGGVTHPVYFVSIELKATWRDPEALAAVRVFLLDRERRIERRVAAIDVLGMLRDVALPELAGKLIVSDEEPLELRRHAISALGQLREAEVAEVLVGNYAKLSPELRPQAIDVLSQRPIWSRPLLAAVRQQEIPATDVHVNHVRRMQQSRDEELTSEVRQIWGVVRGQRNEAREDVIETVAEFLQRSPGDPQAGAAVFRKVCAQCHQIYGEGQSVGPDLSHNGRNSFEQLLSNVLDPSLVIGADYQARTVATADGRILVGLLAEDSAERVVLKVQGGKLEPVARGEIDTMEVSPLSLMPEELEKQITPEEMADLFAYLSLDQPPGHPQAKLLPGAPQPRATPPP
jgi:putative heme-binding domain-containing protein